MDASTFNEELDKFLRITAKVLNRSEDREYAPMVYTVGDDITCRALLIEGEMDSIAEFVKGSHGFGHHLRKRQVSGSVGCAFVCAKMEDGGLFVWGATDDLKLNGAVIDLSGKELLPRVFPFPCQESFIREEVNPALAYMKGLTGL